MRFQTFVAGFLLTGLVSARNRFHVKKALPGNTEIEGCGQNKILRPKAVTVSPYYADLAELELNLTATTQIKGGSGTLYAYDAHDFEELDQVQIDFCKNIAENHCPVKGDVDGASILFETKGRKFWDIDLSLDIFNADGSKQILCLYGPAAPKPDDKLVQQSHEKSSGKQKIVVDVHWDM